MTDAPTPGYFFFSPQVRGDLRRSDAGPDRQNIHLVRMRRFEPFDNARVNFLAPIV